MITVDGQAVNPGGADGGDSDGETLRVIRLELKLCKALAALNPPHDVSARTACPHRRPATSAEAARRHRPGRNPSRGPQRRRAAPGREHPPRHPRPAHLGSRLQGRRNRIPRRPRRLRHQPHRRAGQARHPRPAGTRPRPVRTFSTPSSVTTRARARRGTGGERSAPGARRPGAASLARGRCRVRASARRAAVPATARPAAARRHAGPRHRASRPAQGGPSNGADDSFAVKVRRLGRSLRSRRYAMAQAPP